MGGYGADLNDSMNQNSKDVALKEALRRVEYLEYMLKEAHTKLTERSYEHGEMCILTGKPAHMCLATFDNLDRICHDVKLSIKQAMK
jgi:hypothetical protein